jgi:hypothetical protein
VKKKGDIVKLKSGDSGVIQKIASVSPDGKVWYVVKNNRTKKETTVSDLAFMDELYESISIIVNEELNKVLLKDAS